MNCRKERLYESTMKRKPNRIRKKKVKTRKKQNIDWSPRYGDLTEHKILCARTHAATGGICCVCMKAKSQEIHHTRYLGDKDTPGKNLFPTCVRCHDKVCHHPSLWVETSNPLWGNHNTTGFEKRLQVSYKLLNQQLRNG